MCSLRAEGSKVQAAPAVCSLQAEGSKVQAPPAVSSLQAEWFSGSGSTSRSASGSKVHAGSASRGFGQQRQPCLRLMPKVPKFRLRQPCSLRAEGSKFQGSGSTSRVVCSLQAEGFKAQAAAQSAAVSFFSFTPSSQQTCVPVKPKPSSLCSSSFVSSCRSGSGDSRSCNASSCQAPLDASLCCGDRQLPIAINAMAH